MQLPDLLISCFSLVQFYISRYHYYNFIQNDMKKGIFVTEFPFSNGLTALKLSPPSSLIVQDQNPKHDSSFFSSMLPIPNYSNSIAQLQLYIPQHRYRFFSVSKCSQSVFSKLLKLRKRLQLMPLSFSSRTQSNFSFSSLLLFKFFLISCYSSVLIIYQFVKLPFEQFRKPLLFYYPDKSLLTDKSQ